MNQIEARDLSVKECLKMIRQLCLAQYWSQDNVKRRDRILLLAKHALNNLSTRENPELSAVWTCGEAKDHHVTKQPLPPRMHLNREQVAAVIAHLQSWLDDDTPKNNL